MTLNKSFFERPTNIKAQVLCDSVCARTGKRIVTFLCEFPRFILPEVLTHKMVERNTSSSRAIPIKTMVENIRNNIAMPTYWGKNKSGMSADVEVDDKGLVQKLWKAYSEDAIEDSLFLAQEGGLHKQIANRITEPFQMVKMLMTATEWDNFFHLRIAKDAQPEICMLAYKMYKAMQDSTPFELEEGEWHLPYVDRIRVDGEGSELLYFVNDEEVSLEQAQRVSASCIAQTSYRKSDDSLEKAEKVFDMLVNGDVMHCFDEKQEVYTNRGFVKFRDLLETDLVADVCVKTGVFKGFKKPMNYFHSKHSGKMYSGTGFCVTGNHTITAYIDGDLKKRSTLKQFTFEDFSGGKQFWQKPLTMLKSMRTPDGDKYNPFGILIGMYIGDGFKPKNWENIGMMFRFKKERKIKILKNVLGLLGLSYSETTYKDGVTVLKIEKTELTEEILNTCKRGTSNKGIGNWSEHLYPSIFHGLLSSDGSVKRNTYSFSTTSDGLKNDFLMYAPLAGLCVKLNKKQGTSHRLMVQTKLFHLFNDVRTDSSLIEQTDVKDVDVYCVQMESGGLLVRRDGNTLVMGNSSPFGSMATPVVFHGDDKNDTNLWQKGVTHLNKYGVLCSGNLIGWVSYRHGVLPQTQTCYEFDFDKRMEQFEG